MEITTPMTSQVPLLFCAVVLVVEVASTGWFHTAAAFVIREPLGISSRASIRPAYVLGESRNDRDNENKKSSLSEFRNLPDFFGTRTKDWRIPAEEPRVHLETLKNESSLSTTSQSASPSAVVANQYRELQNSSRELGQTIEKQYQELQNSSREIGQQIEAGVNEFTGETKAVMGKIAAGGEQCLSELQCAIPKSPARISQQDSIGNSYLATLAKDSTAQTLSPSELFEKQYEELQNSSREIGQQIEAGVNEFTGETKAVIGMIAAGGEHCISEFQRAIPRSPAKTSRQESIGNSYLATLAKDSTSQPLSPSELFEKQYEELQNSSREISQQIEAGVSGFTGESKAVMEKIQRVPQEAVSSIQAQYQEAWESSIKLDERIKSKVNTFTGDEEYKIGNITRAIIHKIASKEYDLSELTFLFRLLVALGADLSLVTGFVPFKLLTKAMGFGLTLELGEKAVTSFAVEVDKRLNSDKFTTKSESNGTTNYSQAMAISPAQPTEFATGNSNSPTLSVIANITGKNTYKVGDLASAMGDGGNDEKTNEIDLSVLQELEECLAIEKALLEKLGAIRRAGATQSTDKDDNSS